jgi:Zn-dependent protease
MSEAGVRVNLIIMFLNLIPILPLDGGRILASLLPNRVSGQYSRLEPWGIPLLLVLVVTNMLDIVIAPLLMYSESLIHAFVFL